MTNKITKLYEFLQKEKLPPNAVYVSEEKPPEDKQGRVTVPVYQTENKADYWIRTLQPTDEEEEVAPPKDYELSKVTEDYIDRYSLAMQDGYEDFNKKVNDPSTPEYARMTDLVHLFVDRNFDKKRQKGLASYSNPLELLTALADGGYKELSKPTSTSLFKIATTKTRGPKHTDRFVVNPKTGNRDIPINPLNPKAKVVLGGTDHQRGAYNAHANGNHEIHPEALLQVLESFITSRFPGNDGFDIPSWHLDNINELWMNGRIKEVKTHKAGIKGTIAGEALRGLPKAFYATNEYNNDKPIWLMPREEIERLTEEKDKGNISQLELDAMVEPIKEEPLNAQWITIYNANHQYPPQSREKNEPQMVEGIAQQIYWSPERKQQRARQRFDGANTVIHEMSHQLWNGEHCKQWMKATVLKEYLRALEEDKGFPSQYAKISNEHEFFSECYTAYVMHTKAFKERNPKMAELMENFFKGKPESRDLTDEEADLLKNRDELVGKWERQFKRWQKEDSDYARHRLSLKEPRITKEAEEDDEEHIPEIIQDTFQIGKFNPAAANISMGDTEINPDWFTPVDDEETDVSKSWITNPRGSEDSYREDHDDTEYKKIKTLKKEGDGGGDGGFGDGGGTVFTSANAGVFTPTYSDRSTRRKRKSKKKSSGIERLGDFITDNSPERKMEKSVVELLKWVTIELRKDDNKHFRQQTSGETINSQPPRLDWKKGNREVTENNNEPSEFEGHPDDQAAISQNNTTRRIKHLDDEDESDRPKDTGSASVAAPAGVNIKLAWVSGGIESDELYQGGDKDKEQGQVEELEDEHEDEDFVEELFKEIEKELDNL